MTKIKEGDLVKLKSGSPVMTVQYFKNGDWYCTYFSTTKSEFVTNAFTEDSILKTS